LKKKKNQREREREREKKDGKVTREGRPLKGEKAVFRSQYDIR
jgi:hypothetical protein